MTKGFADLDGGALDRWLKECVADFAQLEVVERFPGGQSNPTYRISDGRTDFVLRRKPFGKLLPSAHAVEREFRVISALHTAGFPVPQPYALCDDDSIIGSAFYVMELAAGDQYWDALLPSVEEATRAGFHFALVDTLAKLHQFDPEAIGLGEYGAPGNYCERQVRRWTKQYRASETGKVAEMEQLIDWLPRTLPHQDRISVIHGDFRLDNVIFATGSQRVIAVLDWELSTTGDPLADFAYLAMNWISPRREGTSTLGGFDLTGTGVPSLEQMVERYCQQTGRTAIPGLDWYFAFNLFRLASIYQGIKKRMLDGNAASPAAEERAARIVPLARRACEFAERADG